MPLPVGPDLGPRRAALAGLRRRRRQGRAATKMKMDQAIVSADTIDDRPKIEAQESDIEHPRITSLPPLHGRDQTQAFRRG
jgi:hypothetical protein